VRRWLVAADGANSAVRRLTGTATREWDYLHNAIVTSVRSSQPHRRTAWQRFTDTGPLAFLPLVRDGQEDWCSIVWSTTPAESARLMALDEENFCRELERAFEGRLGDGAQRRPAVCVCRCASATPNVMWPKAWR